MNFLMKIKDFNSKPARKWVEVSNPNDDKINAPKNNLTPKNTDLNETVFDWLVWPKMLTTKSVRF